MHIRSRVLIPCFVLALVTTPVLAAEPGSAEPSAAEASVARDHFKKGIDAAKASRWDEARAAFQRSYEVWPRTITLLNLAGAQAESGKLVAAAESYRKFIRQAGMPGAEPKAAAQKGAAEQALAQIEPRIAHVRLRVDNLAGDDRIQMDGQVLPHAMIGVPIPADAQEHEVVVVRAGANVASSSFHVGEGESKEITLTAPTLVSPDRAAPPQAAPSSSSAARAGWYRPTPDAPPRKEKDRGGILASPIFWGIAGVVVVGGTVTGVVLATQGGDAAPAAFTGSVTPGRMVVR